MLELNQNMNTANQEPDPNKGARKIRFATLIPSSKAQEYWQYIDKGFELASSELANKSIEIDKHYFDQYDVEDFVEKACEILQSRPRAVVIAPVFIPETLNFIEGLNKLKIPYSFVDSLIPDTNFKNYYGQNAFQSGYLVAEILFDTAQEIKQALWIHFKRKGTEPIQTTTRYKGFLQYLEDNNLKDKVEIIELELIPGNDVFNKQLIDHVFHCNPNLSAAIAFDSKIHKLAMHLSKKIRIIAYDALPVNLKYLREGTVYCLITQEPQKQSYLTIIDLYQNLIENKQIDQINYMPIGTLFREDLLDKDS